MTNLRAPWSHHHPLSSTTHYSVRVVFKRRIHERKRTYSSPKSLCECDRPRDAVRKLEADIESSSDDSQKAQLHVELGHILRDEYLHGSSALQHFQKAFQADPARLDALVEARELYLDLGKVGLVQKLLNRELQERPEGERAALYLEMGNVLRDMGDFENAAVSYAESLNLAPAGALLRTCRWKVTTPARLGDLLAAAETGQRTGAGVVLPPRVWLSPPSGPRTRHGGARRRLPEPACLRSLPSLKARTQLRSGSPILSRFRKTSLTTAVTPPRFTSCLVHVGASANRLISLLFLRRALLLEPGNFPIAYLHSFGAEDPEEGRRLVELLHKWC